MLRFLLFPALLLAALQAESFVSSKVCKQCHPLIYKEYAASLHRNASIYNDPVHKAVWDRHPAKAKERYGCAACHTPTDTKLTADLNAKKPAMPEPNRWEKEEAINCAYCHRIESIEKHTRFNTNRISPKAKTFFAAKNGKTTGEVLKFHREKSFFGLSGGVTGSPFHTIDYGNRNFVSGETCMGCHDHKRNAKGFAVCDMEVKAGGKATCISCHMPQVKGSFSTIVDSKTHAYHGFAGVYNAPQALAKTVRLSVEKNRDGFTAVIVNDANHRLFAHPLRLGLLKATIGRDGREIALKPVAFYRVIGVDGKPSMPWLAEEVVRENAIGAFERKAVFFDTPLQPGDRLTLTLGVYPVNPKAAKKLGLGGDKSATEFVPFVTKHFDF